MSASKILTTAVASATIVGAIGFAYAQTSDSNAGSAQGAPQTEQMQNPTAGPATDSTTQPASPSMSSTPSSSSTDSSAAPSSTSTDTNAAPATDSSSEPAPKADRN